MLVQSYVDATTSTWGIIGRGGVGGLQILSGVTNFHWDPIILWEILHRWWFQLFPASTRRTMLAVWDHFCDELHGHFNINHRRVRVYFTGWGCSHPQKYTLYVTAAIDRHMENIVDLVEAGDLWQPSLPLPGMKELKTKKWSTFFVSQVMKKYHQQMRKCKQFKLQGWNLQGYSQHHWPSLRLLFPQVCGTFFFFAPHLYIACRWAAIRTSQSGDFPNPNGWDTK